MVLNFPKGISGDQINKIFNKIWEHHDALRMVFKQTQKGFIQENLGRSPQVQLQEVDLTKADQPEQRLRELSADMRAPFDLTSAPLMRVGLFQLPNSSRLLIVFPEVIIDGFSWFILLDDIRKLYDQLNSDQNLALPLKTDAFVSWNDRLVAYRKEEAFQAAAAYWERFGKEAVVSNRLGQTQGTNFVSDARMQKFRLSAQHTTKLLTEANQPFNTQLQDILLTAFSGALHQQYELNSVLVQLEGHGRQHTLEGANINRTIGNFTNTYPVRLERKEGEVSSQIRQIKEALRSVPNLSLIHISEPTRPY